MNAPGFGNSAGPPELESVRSLLSATRIVALVFGIIALAVGGLDLLAFYALESTCASLSATTGASCPSFAALALVVPLLVIGFAIVDFVVYLEVGGIQRTLAAGDYVRAKAQTLLWLIVGFAFAGIIVGILLLIAYLKFDPLIAWQRAGGGRSPPAPLSFMGPSPPGFGAANAPGPSTRCRYCGANLPPAASFCPGCGSRVALSG